MDTEISIKQSEDELILEFATLGRMYFDGWDIDPDPAKRSVMQNMLERCLQTVIALPAGEHFLKRVCP